ncbi:MAG: hypothetical protein AAFO97_01865 [Pseudomonadota bacterium]
MKRITILFSSLSVMAIVGACGPANEITARAALDPLSFRENPNATAIEIQADALQQMTDQLAQDSSLPRAYNSALVSCGVAIFAPAKGTGCNFGGERRAMLWSGREREVELVPAVALVDDIQDISGQLDAVETSLPALIARQDDALADLTARRDAGVVSEAAFNAEIAAIKQVRTRVDAALAATATQAEQANFNMQTASQRGQSGLDWHLSATAELAREAQVARAQLGLLEQTAPVVQDYVASNAPVFVSADQLTFLPRPGELR